jgi:DNA helicase-2/ATP-dependent DNA helicase PcrA
MVSASGLNPQQSSAVLAPVDCPLMVIAGAGSGKTSVLVRRVQHIIATGVPAAGVLAVTFTKAACDEMHERLTKAIGPAARAITVSTFHALSLSICRAHADRVPGRANDFAVRTTKQQLRVVQRAVRDLQVAAVAGAAAPATTAAPAAAPAAPPAAAEPAKPGAAPDSPSFSLR